MKRTIMKKMLALMLMGCCLAGMSAATSAAMSNHYQTVTYSSGSGGVYTTSYSKTQSATQNSTKPSGVGFVGLAPGAFPAGVSITFKTYYGSTEIASMTKHTYSNYVNGTIKHGSYTGSYGSMTGISVRMKVYDTSGSYGNTLQARWNLGSSSSL